MEFSGPLLEGRWRLGPKIGRGGQGSTFVARDEREVGRIVAVKRLELGHERDWKRFDLFEREARVLESLSHDGVPRFLAHFEGEGGRFYLVMERAPGEDLRAAMGRGGLTEDALRDILVRALAILDYLHGRSPPVIHRDIKPANLVRAEDGKVSLVDFGGVRDVLREGGGTTVVGTFGYMAPEQLHGHASPATDLYGLGATMVALATGLEPERLPRRGLRMDLSRSLEGLSPGLVEVLEKMTAPDPDERPQSATEVLSLLEKRRPRRAPRRQLPARRPAEPEEDGALPLEIDAPAPVRWVVGLSLWAFATAGSLGLAVLRSIVLPILFTAVSAFVSARSRDKLAEARGATNRALDRGRRGFRRLRRAATPRRRQLPPPRERP